MRCIFNRKFLFFFILLYSIGNTVAQAQEEQQIPIAIEPDIINSVLDSLSHQLLKNYILKEKAQLYSDFLKKSKDEKRYDSISNAESLIKKLGDDLQKIYTDKHLKILYNPDIAYEISGEIEDVPKFLEKKLQQDRDKNFGLKKVEILNDNIGLIEFSYFVRLNAHSKQAIKSAFIKLSKTKILIVDLRYGRGGSIEMVNYLMGYFLKKKTLANQVYIRNENTTLNYFSKPDSNSHFFNLPIYVLISNTTFSAAEALSFQLQNYRHVTLVGEQSKGGAHVVNYFPLGNNFVADIPFGNAFDPITKKNWEGIGITPNIKCAADSALNLVLMKLKK